MCGPCSISSRDCAYATAAGLRQQSDVSQDRETTETDVSPAEGAGEGLNLSQTAVPVSAPSIRTNRVASILASPEGVESYHHSPGSYVSYLIQSPRSLDGRQHQAQYAYSPDKVASELLSVDLASTRWLDLLAADAARADHGFSLAPTDPPNPTPGVGTDSLFNARHHLGVLEDSSTGGEPAVRPQAEPGLASAPAHQEGGHSDREQHAWQLGQDICLRDDEVMLFRTFAERAALWLDLFDPRKHFSTHATRLAVRTSRMNIPNLLLLG